MSVQAVVLGSAQDAGLPQAGCVCANCAGVRAGEIPRRFAASLALIDSGMPGAWIIDATPDFREQLELLDRAAPGLPLRGILLTHAHMGHYAGLIHLGREAMNSRALPLHATESMARFLAGNGPWSQLLALSNVSLVPIPLPGQVILSDGLAVEAVPVPHRAEYSDTVAFRIQGPERTLFYRPDIDRWEDWSVDLRSYLETVDMALLDGTFHSADELPGRDLSEIPHPLVADTLAKLRRTACRVWFTHLNHSNPLHRESPEREALREAGFEVACEGMSWGL